MKDSLIVLGFFVGGCLLGALGYLPVDLKTGNMSIYIVCVDVPDRHQYWFQ